MAWEDVELVRFHVGDMEQSAPIFSDEAILKLLQANHGHIGKTVIDCIENIVAQLSMPDFSADWLTIDAKSARESYRALINTKRRAFGLTNAGTIRPAKRRDFTEGD